MTNSLRLGLVLIAALAVIGLASWYFLSAPPAPPATPEAAPPVPAAPATTTPWQTMRVIGTSVEGRQIEAHTYGTGDTHLLFVGGIHGGYEWNSSLLAYEVMDYLALNPETVPSSLTIHIIPDLNPDGTFAALNKSGRFTRADVPRPSERIAAGRFNANQVDLNRNFDCKWQPESTWRNQPVSAGSAPFSEPETAALREYVLAHNFSAAVFWHSQANNVYASECEAGVLPETLTLMNTYATAAGYGAVPVFDAYPITGDAEGWLASLGIPAVTVELRTFTDTEWEQNWAGIQSVFTLYQKP